MAERVKITLDGEEIEVEAGKTILQAALTRGREIPHYCYHDGLSIAGNCRMCLVEVEKMPKLAIGCYTPVADGMVVNTQNERVKKAQQAVMEFLLINHPLDCPICDQAGECRLQDYAVSFGTGKSRYTEPKLALAKAVDIGKHVMLDQDRCIQCSRCTRFCDEITGTGELAFFQRGNKAQIGLHPGKRLDNAYSGNTVDICPVGALTLKEFRFQTRVWYLDNTPSVCALCARGCNVVVSTGQQNVRFTSPGQFDDRVKRIVPRVNEAVNGHWMCDEGRLSGARMEAAPRLERAQLPPGTVTEWEDATSGVVTALGESASAGKAAAILSPRLTAEDLFAWRELLAGLGGARVAIRELLRGENDELLIRADKGANSTGAGWIFPHAVDESAVLDAVGRGEIDTLLIVADPLDPGDVPAIDETARGKLQHLIQVGPFVAGSAERATALLPAAAWTEADGHFVNFEGRVQRVRRAHLPRGEGRPGWRVVADLAEARGLEWPAWSESDDVFRALAEQVSQFNGIDPQRVGLLGAPGRADATAGV
jgi:NADH-quinone oxidoreductase subunit G